VTAVQRAAIASARKEASDAMARWNALKGPELTALNAKLRAAGLEPISPSRSR
jgi:hypothetical protein